MERQQGQKDKSVAWFKLAELIARGEREKALSVFRLLAHSLSDKAYILQVEGDILWYLDDRAALEKYKQAAYLYHKEKRWIDAIAIFEHLVTQRPQQYDYLAQLLPLYALINWPEKFNERFARFVEFFTTHSFDHSQFEKTCKDVVEAVQEDTQRQAYPWLKAEFARVAASLPADQAEKMLLLFE
jgi:tetratricopeptide (TPR) repeat protein